MKRFPEVFVRHFSQNQALPAKSQKQDLFALQVDEKKSLIRTCKSVFQDKEQSLGCQHV